MKRSGDDIAVSSVIATYNRADMLPQALDSLLAQSRPIDELIVIDDASTDHTDQVMASYLDRVRYVRNLENSGQGASLNFGISLAEKPYIWIFDDDDAALPDALANHVEYLQNNPDVDFTYSDKYIIEGDGDIWQRDQWRIDPLPPIDPDDFFERTLYTDNTLFQGMLIPARCHKAAGPFDVSLDRCLDHDLLLRLSRLFRPGNMGHPGYVYREHGGVRGSAAHQHKANERFRVMLDFRQQMFRRVRQTYPLADFTPRFCKHQTLATSPDKLALLQRGCVMLHHGMVEEALEDLGGALEGVSPADHDSDALRAMLSLATHCEAWMWPNARNDLNRLARTLFETHSLSLSAAFARGLYWEANASRRRGQFADSARLLGWMTLFLGKCGYYRIVNRN